VSDSQHDLDIVAAVLRELVRLSFEPVLVGGMALVLLGSRRVTVDFDFVISHPGERLEELVDVFYDQELEVVSSLNDAGDPIATIDSRRVATTRLRIDAPAGAYFYNRATRLRIDVLFDFPVPAATLAARATRLKVRSHVFAVASEDDLLELKQIARAARDYAGDAQDIAFLEARRKWR
jgi:Nucleotidyl transferase AbiEii toxin, Type IV TA system